MSSSYYALFHFLARECANALIGKDRSEPSKAAWRQVYRSLDHGPARDRCKGVRMVKYFPKEIEDFADAFVTLQAQRHEADYDPFASFVRLDVEDAIASTERVIERFKTLGVRERRAFCAHVLFRQRS